MEFRPLDSLKAICDKGIVSLRKWLITWIEKAQTFFQKKITPDDVAGLERTWKLDQARERDVEASPHTVEEEKQVMPSEESKHVVSLYDEVVKDYVEYTEDDLFSLVTGNEKVLEKFGYTKDDEEYLNKGLFVSMLGQFKSEKGKQCLYMLLLWPFSEKSSYFPTVDTAAWQILLKYSSIDRDWVIQVFKEAFVKGNYGAKLSCTLYAPAMVEEELLEPLHELAEKGQDERLKRTALRELRSLKEFLNNGVKTQDLLSPEFPSISF